MIENPPNDDSSSRVSTSDDIEVGTYLEIAQADRAQGNNSSVDERMKTIVILDFGSQYSRLIARRVREANTYCELVPHDAGPEILEDQDVVGIILSGGPNSVYEDDAPMAPTWVYDAGVPILGICYGMQLIAHQLGGTVARGTEREYGHAVVHKDGQDNILFNGLENEVPVWMSHGDKVTDLPEGFKVIASNQSTPVAGIANELKNIYGFQFHPEVTHTPQGLKIIKRFVIDICESQASWNMPDYVETAVKKIKEKVGKDDVILGLSGGVDSSVAAMLIHRAIGDQLTCIFVDNGLLRLNEAEIVMKTYNKNLGVKVIHIDATKKFMNDLIGISDPEKKRKIIGRDFIEVFQEEAKKIPNAKWLAQGTIYPDVIESAGGKTKKAHNIKSHHNVGGLPDTLNLKLLEPLRELFKDEVRELGIALGLEKEMVYRHPFLAQVSE